MTPDQQPPVYAGDVLPAGERETLLDALAEDIHWRLRSEGLDPTGIAWQALRRVLWQAIADCEVVRG